MTHKRYIPWDADATNATSKGLSSLDVLVLWISDPGNFECWNEGGTSKSDAEKSLVAALKEHGIHHRSLRAVEMKLKAIVQQYVAASTVLVEEGGQSGYLDEEDVDKRVEKRVLKRCPYYRMVAPILSNFSFSEMEPKDWTTCDDSEDTDYVETGARDTVTKRKRKTTSGDHQMSKRRIRLHITTEEGISEETEEGTTYGDQDTANGSIELDTVTCTDLVAVPSREISSLEFQRKMENCRLDYAQKSTHRLLITERVPANFER